MISFVLPPHARAQFGQQGSKLVGTDAVGNAYQGESVSLSADGNTALVGGYGDNSATGAAWIFTRSAGVWSQQGSKLVGTGAVGSAYQGLSVSLSSDGNTAIVGGCGDNSNTGAAWVFTRSAGVWSQQGSKLVGTGAVGIASQGVVVSLSSDGNTAIVGGGDDNSGVGAAWVFTRSAGVWSQQGNKLIGTDAVGSARQGYSVSISSDGNTAIVGGFYDNGLAGAAWVFTRSAGVWSQQGSKLVGTGAVGGAEQGRSVSLSSDGNTAIVGGYGDSSATGAAWIFTRSAGVWSQQGNKLVGSGAVSRAVQGISVSLSADGNTAIVGGYYDNGVVGAAWIFTRSAGVWSQLGSKLVGTGAVGYALQGSSVSLSADGSTAIVGGMWDNSDVGAAWIWVDAKPSIVSIKDVANDQGGKVRVTWNRSVLDMTGNASITSYGLWRRIPPWMSLGKSTGMKKISKLMNDTLGTLYDFVIDVPGVQSPSYNVVVETLSDSMNTGNYIYSYIVTAHTSDPNVIFISQPDSGYSVDNIPPLTPGNSSLASLSDGTMKLSWQQDPVDRDLKQYNVYRATISGFTVDQSTLLHSTTDTVYTDASAIYGQVYCYRIAAEDIHGNISQPTSELSAAALSLELTSFAASAMFNNVNLSWTTSTETNTYGFEIDRRLVSQTGALNVEWAKAGFVEGAGTSNAPKSYSFTERNLSPGEYEYRLKQIDRDGSFIYSQSVEVEAGIAPKVFELSQNFPNPFNPATSIEFTVPTDGQATLRVFNALGQEVAVLFNEEAVAGIYHQVQFNASNLSSGIYYSRLEFGGKLQAKKMLLLK